MTLALLGTSHLDLIVIVVVRGDRARNHQGGEMIDEVTSLGETITVAKNAALCLNPVAVRLLAIIVRSVCLSKALPQAVTVEKR